MSQAQLGALDTWVREHVLERTPLAGHDGRSGARIERVFAKDGRRLILKTSSASTDITASIGGGVPDRELRLWSTGVLDRLPEGVGHCIVDGWLEPDGRVVTIMTDLGDRVLSWDRRLTAGECALVIEAMASMHGRFAGSPPPGLVPLESWLTGMSPAAMQPLASGPNPLPALVVRGWACFADLAPRDVAAAVAEIHANPGPLADRLRADGTTLAHADLWPVNCALLDSGDVILLDWALAAAAPGAFDLAGFVVGGASQTDMSRDALVDAYEDASGCRRPIIDAALLAVLCLYGWNKALDAAEHPDTAKRAAEQADLDWWIAQAERAIGGA